MYPYTVYHTSLPGDCVSWELCHYFSITSQIQHWKFCEMNAVSGVHEYLVSSFYYKFCTASYSFCLWVYIHIDHLKYFAYVYYVQKHLEN